MTHENSGAGRSFWIAVAAVGLVASLALLAFVALRPTPAPQGAVAAAPAPAPSDVAAPPAPRDAADPPVDHAGIPHTALPLRLVATIVRESHSLSLATVEDTEEGGHQVLVEGDAFFRHPEAQVASIERGRVLIDNAGVREQLVLDRSLGAPLADADNAPTREQMEYRRDLAARLRALTDAGTNYRELRGGDVRGGLLAEGDLSPVYEGDEMIGIQVDGIREGGVYEQLGLRNGDVVTSVNGVLLGEPTATAAVLAELARSEVISVAVERPDGSDALLSVPTSTFAAAVGGLE